jgi:hypothetical protein
MGGWVGGVGGGSWCIVHVCSCSFLEHAPAPKRNCFVQLAVQYCHRSPGQVLLGGVRGWGAAKVERRRVLVHPHVIHLRDYRPVVRECTHVQSLWTAAVSVSVTVTVWAGAM